MAERKRKQFDNDRMMVLFKRLHLDRGSELYQKAVSSSPKRHPTPKRLRLSPIREVEVSNRTSVSTDAHVTFVPRHPRKRRRLDSDMADTMNKLWISGDNESRDTYDKSAPLVEFESIEETVQGDDGTIKRIELTVDLGGIKPSLETKVIRDQIKLNNMQVVEWVPSPLDLLTTTESEPEVGHEMEEG